MAEFYNEADHIDYPFIKGFNRAHSGGTFDGKAFLDLRITIGPDTDFFEFEDTVTCTGFSVGATDVIFSFLVENVGIMNFIVPLTSPYGFAITAEIILSSKVVATGVLVTSDLAYFVSLALAAYTFNVPPIVIPTLITSLRGTFVTEIVAANSPRRRPLECCDVTVPPTPAVPPVFIVNTFPLAGDIVSFKEGFNCFITITESNNTITLGSRLGAGVGEDDGLDPFLVDNWPFQVATPFKCCDFISSINGVPASADNVFELRAQGGLALVSDPFNNTINSTLSNQGPACAT